MGWVGSVSVIGIFPCVVVVILNTLADRFCLAALARALRMEPKHLDPSQPINPLP